MATPAVLERGLRMGKNLLSETGDGVEVALSVADLSLDFRRSVDWIGPSADGHAGTNKEM